MEATTETASPRRAARQKGSVNRLDPDGAIAAAEAQTIAREPARTAIPHGRAVALDRDGKPLARRRDNTENQFYVPEHLKEEGWDYQWNVKSVLGEESVSTQIRDMENGWRPVPAEREGFSGRFMPAGHKGPIDRDGLILCERPMSLTDEARAEDRYNANAQRAENRKRFGLPALPPGFEDRQDRLGQFGKGKPGVHVGIEGAPRAEGKYQMAIDGDE